MIDILLEALRSSMYWARVALTLLGAYAVACVLARSCYRPPASQAPQTARRSLGWGLLLAGLLLAILWHLWWAWFMVALVVVPFIVLGGVILLVNSR